MTAAAASLLLAHGLAHADSDGGGVDTRDQTGEPVFALRMGLGGLHIGGHDDWMFSDGLQGSTTVGWGVRVFGEAALLWSFGPSDVAMDEHGFGARSEVGVRRALVTALNFLYVDAEAGGGLALVADSQLGNHSIPGGFVGLRTGYVLGGGTNNARLLEAAFDLRLYETPQGHNWVFGVSIGWGR
jgi:hypothetical protein